MSAVLIVDNSRISLEMLTMLLVDAGYHVYIATDGHAALATAEEQRPDLIILEWQLSGVDGLTVIRRIREFASTPILMLTTRSALEDRVTALDSGADDYLVKPYVHGELLARLRALLRRAQGSPSSQVLTYGDLALDPVTLEVRRGTRRLALSPREFELLSYLMSHPRQVLRREQILLAVWGYDFVGAANVLEVYIGYLRRKLEADGEPRLIQTIWGIGYVLQLV